MQEGCQEQPLPLEGRAGMTGEWLQAIALNLKAGRYVAHVAYGQV